jgi:hypothetical protein
MHFHRFFVPWLLAASCGAVVGTLTSPARGEVEADARDAARLEYQRGLELAKHGDYTTALAAFRGAYARSPHFMVLYNIAQAEIALGRPIAAAEALSAYLEQGGTRIAASRRQQVAAQLEWLRSRFAEVTLAGAKPDTRIGVDGGEATAIPVSQPLRLSPGTHRLSLLEPGVPPLHRVVTLIAGERTLLRLDTLPADAGMLSVECAEAGAELLVDGLPVDWLRATQGVAIAAGRHRVAFSAPGQRWTERTIEVRVGESAKVECPSPASATGTLAVTCEEPGTSVFIDGKPLSLARAEAGVALSAGRHTVSFRAPGLHFPEQSFDMPGAAALMLWCGAPERAESLSRRPADDFSGSTNTRFTQTHAGLVSGGAGLLLGVAAGGHYLWNRGRYADWRTEDEALVAADGVPDHRERQLANNALADSIERASRVSVGMGVAGAALLSAGMLLIALDPGEASRSGRKNAWERIALRIGAGLPGTDTAFSYSGTLP